MKFNKGSAKASPQFKSGINYLNMLGAACVTYTSTRTGEMMNCFVLEAGNHYIRVPTDAVVDIDCAETVAWAVRSYNPHEQTDQTPTEVTVIRPRSLRDEMKDYAAALVAKALGVNKDDLESPDDLDDFDVDEAEETPLTLHEIRAMEIDGSPEAKQVEAPTPPPAKPSSSGDESPKPNTTGGG